MSDQDKPINATVTLYLGEWSARDLKDLRHKILNLLMYDSYGITAEIRQIGEISQTIHLGEGEVVSPGFLIDSGDTSHIIWDAGRYWEVHDDISYPLRYPLRPGDSVEVGPLERSSWWVTPSDPPHDLALREFHLNAVTGDWDELPITLAFADHDLRFSQANWNHVTATIWMGSERREKEVQIRTVWSYEAFRDSVLKEIDIYDHEESEQ